MRSRIKRVRSNKWVHKNKKILFNRKIQLSVSMKLRLIGT